MVNYVGNWTLLEKALVNDYENDVGDLDAKASLLNRSNVQTNRELALQLRDGWDDEKVAKRQQEFADQSIVLW